MIAAVLHIPRHRTQHVIDFTGSAVLGAGVTAVILLTTWGGVTYAWGSGVIIGLAVAAVAVLAFALTWLLKDVPLRTQPHVVAETVPEPAAASAPRAAGTDGDRLDLH